jgi:hypothetical protein
MGIVQFPGGGKLPGRAERLAFRDGLGRRMSTARPSLRLIAAGQNALYCAACAAPVDFGAVWRGEEVYCSVECSLGGNRPA